MQERKENIPLINYTLHIILRQYELRNLYHSREILGWKISTREEHHIFFQQLNFTSMQNMESDHSYESEELISQLIID